MQNKKRKFRVFHSFEEENLARAEEWAAISGIDHLKNTIELIKKIYNYEFSSNAERKIKVISK